MPESWIICYTCREPVSSLVAGQVSVEGVTAWECQGCYRLSFLEQYKELSPVMNHRCLGRKGHGWTCTKSAGHSSRCDEIFNADSSGDK